METRLRAIGEWLQTNGEAIYGSRPWIRAAQENPPIRFTTKENTLYAIVLEPVQQPIVIPFAQETEMFEVTQVSLLGSNASIRWRYDNGALQIEPAAEMPGQHAWTFKIERALK